MPESTSLHVEGLDELQKALKQYPKMVEKEMTKTMKTTVLSLQRRIAKYPPAPAGSTYKRGSPPKSENLGKSWTNEVKTTGPSKIKGILGTKTSYAKWVQGASQTRKHEATGWLAVDKLLEQKTRAIQRLFGMSVQKILSKIAQKGA